MSITSRLLTSIFRGDRVDPKDPEYDDWRRQNWMKALQTFVEYGQTVGNAGILAEARAWERSCDGGKCPICDRDWVEVRVDNIVCLGRYYVADCTCEEGWERPPDKPLWQSPMTVRCASKGRCKGSGWVKLDEWPRIVNDGAFRFKNATPIYERHYCKKCQTAAENKGRPKSLQGGASGTEKESTGKEQDSADWGGALAKDGSGQGRQSGGAKRREQDAAQPAVLDGRGDVRQGGLDL